MSARVGGWVGCSSYVGGFRGKKRLKGLSMGGGNSISGFGHRIPAVNPSGPSQLLGKRRAHVLVLPRHFILKVALDVLARSRARSCDRTWQKFARSCDRTWQKIARLCHMTMCHRGAWNVSGWRYGYGTGMARLWNEEALRRISGSARRGSSEALKSRLPPERWGSSKRGAKSAGACRSLMLGSSEAEVTRELGRKFELRI